MAGISQIAQFAAAAPATERPALAPPFWPGFLLAGAATSIAIGIVWDISWHETIGRDTFWTPAHMAIYLGGVVAGFVGGWLAIYYTFLAKPGEEGATVQVFGAHAPLGAWFAIWGAIAMITSAPFDNWWHNAYGLDVKIISPPHALLALGMFGITFGALMLVLTRQNQLENGEGSGLFIYVGGVFLVLGSVFVLEYTFPNMQHAAVFYRICALTFPIRLVTMSRAGRAAWPATGTAAVYIVALCLLNWILPLFPAQPKLAPIYNPVTHMVPLPFPLLLIFPALAIDLILRNKGDARGFKRIALALVLGAVFLAVFVPVQWYFSEFLLSPHGENWFFVGNRVWGYNNTIGEWTTRYWRTNPSNPGADLVNVRSLAVCWALAAFTSWLGLLLGGWMRKVRR